MQIIQIAYVKYYTTKMVPNAQEIILNFKITKIACLVIDVWPKIVVYMNAGRHIGFMEIRHISPRWIRVHF